MPSVNVRYYSRLRDLVSKNAEAFHIDQGATVQDLITAVVCRNPQLIPFQGTWLIARNAEYTQAGAEIHDGDVVDLMPPVSGG